VLRRRGQKELACYAAREILLESATPLGERRVRLPGEEEAFARFGDLAATGGIVNAFRASELAKARAAERPGP
jgi:hypothetical protein